MFTGFKKLKKKTPVSEFTSSIGKLVGYHHGE